MCVNQEKYNWEIIILNYTKTFKTTVEVQWPYHEFERPSPHVTTQ